MSVLIHTGDCRAILSGMAAASMDCCVTSPPYFGLRDYGHEGQMGLEPTPDEYIAGMVEVFRHVRRVLRDDGTLWLNIGDSYAANGERANNNGTGASGLKRNVKDEAKRQRCLAENKVFRGSLNRINHGAKPKDLIGIPWMLAFALRADGWYLRQDIIWSKPNPMPESVTDRCTKAHEYLFLLTKRPRYYFDAEAIKEPSTYAGDIKRTNGNDGMCEGTDGHRTRDGFRRGVAVPDQRNKRSVWTVATQPFSEAHFATFPPELIEPCIKAGCPVGGTVLDPFGGAGTTGLVADRLQRNAVLIELNPEYAAMARRRIDNDRGGLLDAMEAA